RRRLPDDHGLLPARRLVVRPQSAFGRALPRAVRRGDGPVADAEVPRGAADPGTGFHAVRALVRAVRALVRAVLGAGGDAVRRARAGAGDHAGGLALAHAAREAVAEPAARDGPRAGPGGLGLVGRPGGLAGDLGEQLQRPLQVVVGGRGGGLPPLALGERGTQEPGGDLGRERGGVLRR